MWEPMKKRKLQTWKKAAKKITIIGSTETVELREDRYLFACMLLVCKTRPQIDIKQAVGTYESTVVLKFNVFCRWVNAAFARFKSSLMCILEKLPAIAAYLTTNVLVVPNQDKTTNVPVVSSEELTTNVSVVSNEELNTSVSIVSNEELTTNVPFVSSEELNTNVSAVSNGELTTKVSDSVYGRWNG